MKQLESFAIDSPCQQICRFNRQRYCRTCLRHMDERVHWDEYDDEEKRRVLRKCYRRKLAYRRAAYLQSEQARQRAAPSPARQLDLFSPAVDKPASTHARRQKRSDDDDSPQRSLF